MWDWLCSQFFLLERWIAHRITNGGFKIEKESLPSFIQKTGKYMNTNRLLNFRMSSRQLFLLYNAEVDSGHGIWRIWQISFYWLLNWPSRGTNRREAEQWRKKKGRLKILKRVNISLMAKGLVYLIFVRGPQTNILKCKETSALKWNWSLSQKNFF